MRPGTGREAGLGHVSSVSCIQVAETSPGHSSIRRHFHQLVQHMGKAKLLHKFANDLSYPSRMEYVRAHLFRIGKCKAGGKVNCIRTWQNNVD